jgi:hypothetical protein
VVRDDKYRSRRGEIVRSLVVPEAYLRREQLEKRLKSRQRLMTIATIFEGTGRKLLEVGPGINQKVERTGTLEAPVEPQPVEDEPENKEETVKKSSPLRKAKTETTRRSPRLAGKRKAEETQVTEAKRKKDAG